MSNQELKARDLEAAANAAKDLISSTIDKLKANVEVGAQSTRLFFPNGIELINVEVTLNDKDGIKFSFKIAGGKGLKETLLTGETSDISASAGPSAGDVTPSHS